MKSILHEVKMSPATLQKMSKNVTATVGFEVELLVPASNDELPDKTFKNANQLFQYIHKYLPQTAQKQIAQTIENTVSTKSKNPSVRRREEEQAALRLYPDSSKLQLIYSTFETIKDQISNILQKPAKAGTVQHSVPRDASHYIVEPDTSLKPPKGYSGVEIISPPMTLESAIADLEKIQQWAKSTGGITNRSTGLHIGVSIPNMDNVDYLKLVLFVGDEYVLSQFDRSSNIYAPSTLKEIQKRTENFYSDPESFAKLQELFAKLKTDLSVNAENALQMFPVATKNISVHFKKSYVEFRSPGGDWLATQSFSTIVSTIHRFVVALAIAADPARYRREYSIKLYKTLNLPSATGIDMFAKWAAGDLSLQGIRDFKSQPPVVIVSDSRRAQRVNMNDQQVAIVFGSTNDEIKQGLSAVGINFAEEKKKGANFTVVSLTPSELSGLNLKTAIRI